MLELVADSFFNGQSGLDISYQSLVPCSPYAAINVQRFFRAGIPMDRQLGGHQI